MTRPGGVTPIKALPYPGSANIQAETPKALQSLAEAIDAQLSSVQGGYQFAFWAGALTLDSAGQSPVLNFPGLRSVAGALVSLGYWLPGTVYRAGWATAAGSTGRFYVNAANASMLGPGGGQETFAGATVAVCVAAWGMPA